jgi:ribosome-associated translation inhibitor RaiA
MDIPLELSFHNMDSSDMLKAAVREHVAKLEQFHDHLIGCRVVIEMPHKSHRIGSNTPDVHVVLRVPGREIVVSRELAKGAGAESARDAYAVLDDAFRATQQQLKEYRRIQHGAVKAKRVDEQGAENS